MSRRSSRLMSCSYYNSDDESDSSTVPTISYRENAVRIFRRKVGVHKKPASLSLIRTIRPLDPAGLSPSPLSLQADAPMGPLAPPTPTPPTPLFLGPGRKELSQSALDSSGYSSSDGPRRKTPTTGTTGTTGITGTTGTTGTTKTTKTTRTTGTTKTTETTKTTKTSGAPSAAYWDTIRCAFYSLMGVPRVKKTCIVLLLLFLALLCVWLLPFLTSFVSLVADREPVLPPLPPPLPPLQHVVVEEQLKQQLAQVKEGLRLDLQDSRVQMDLQDSRVQMDLQDSRVQMDLQDSRVQMDLQDSRVQLAAVDSVLRGQVEDLVLRVQDLEAQNAKLSQAPPAPCPETSRDQLTPELQQAMEAWLKLDSACRRPLADKMADFALESQGASVVSTRCSETYSLRSACVLLFGLPLWFRSESPRTVIQGYPDMLPGRCWAFHGVQGTLLISLSHPITLTHVTLDHLPLYNSPTGAIDSAPKDFEVYGMKDEEDEGALLGSFTYDEAGEPTQTFRLPKPSGEVHRCVELRVLSNWGHVLYTCLYRFRVHGKIAATP